MWHTYHIGYTERFDKLQKVSTDLFTGHADVSKEELSLIKDSPIVDVSVRNAAATALNAVKEDIEEKLALPEDIALSREAPHRNFNKTHYVSLRQFLPDASVTSGVEEAETVNVVEPEDVKTADIRPLSRAKLHAKAVNEALSNGALGDEIIKVLSSNTVKDKIKDPVAEEFGHRSLSLRN